MAAAKAAGAEAADASLIARESLSVDVRLGQLEAVEREESRSIGLRIFFGKRQAAATSSDVSPAGLEALAERVAAMARIAPEDPYCGLLEAEHRASDFPDLDLEDDVRLDATALEEIAVHLEAAARAVPGITNSGGAGAQFDARAAAFGASDGFLASSRSTSYGFGVSPIAEKDGQKERDYDGRSKRKFADLPAVEALGREAGERAVARLGSRKLESRRAPVIFENRLAARMIGPYLSAISGSAIARGVSFLRDKLGERVFPAGFEIIEDPLRPRGLGSRRCDGEGGRVSQRALVADGVVTTWLLNSATARQLNMTPTGHASLGHGGPPGIAASNVMVTPGARDLAGLMADAASGLVVTEMFSPALNANTGDYSVGVSGYWFENGARAFPVSEITIAGNLLEIYGRLIAGSDLEIRGTNDSPSLLVDDLAIAGV